MICPSCNKPNKDNWPIEVNGEIREGGCQNCWEEQCDRVWWQQIDAINKFWEKLK